MSGCDRSFHPLSLLDARWNIPAFLYSPLCNDGAYYLGTTKGSLEARVAQHNDGSFGGFTSLRRPVELVFHQEFDRITDAISAERPVKGWRRAKKEALISGRYDLLPELAERRRAPGS